MLLALTTTETKEDESILRSLKGVLSYTILASDGEMGKVDDFYIDDEEWKVRYLVADTGNWLMDRRVLISPEALGEPDWESHRFPVTITREQVKESPHVDTAKPVSRQQELERERWDRDVWPSYWVSGLPGAGGALLTPHRLPGDVTSAQKQAQRDAPGEIEAQTRLRSLNEVEGYSILAADGAMGRVADFVVDDQTWQVRYLVIDTGTWLSGRKVLVAPDWVEWVSWGDGEVRLSMTQEQVRNSPEFDPDAPVNRQYEVRLYDYYGRPKYWE